MDACSEYNRKVLILDRPNPNGHYVDGPILDMKYKSGVSMDYAIILMIFNFIKSISEFLASILIIICAVKYLKKH